MKLRLIKKSGSPRDGRPTVTFGTKGTVSLNVYAKREHGFKVGQKIGIIQDEDKPWEFYLLVTPESEEDLPVLREMTGAKSLLCGYVDAVHAFEKQFGKLEKSAQVLIGEKIETALGTLFVLITAPFRKPKI
jgi:hypothetical protein